MCTKPTCRAPWCLRLEHWISGFVASAQVCPNQCSGGFPIHDCRVAPGLVCNRCGTYWVPNLPPDVARAMHAERMEHAPLRLDGWIEREFKQNAVYVNG